MTTKTRNEKSAWAEFEKIFEMPEATGHPIFRHPEYGVLICGDGEFAGEKELCECEKMTEYGFPQCSCQRDIPYIGLWNPIDWEYEQPANYAIRDENTTREMENYKGWVIIDVTDLTFTGKFCRN